MQSFFNNIYKWILQCMSKWENGKIITEANPVAEGKGKAQKFVREVSNDELIQVRWTSQTSLLFNHVRQKKRKEKRDKHIIKASLFQDIWDCNLPLFSRTNRRLFMLAPCKTWLQGSKTSTLVVSTFYVSIIFFRQCMWATSNVFESSSELRIEMPIHFDFYRITA